MIKILKAFFTLPENPPTDKEVEERRKQIAEKIVILLMGRK